MRFPAAEKLEIIRLVEQSHLPARRTLEMLGIRRSRSIAGTSAIEPAARGAGRPALAARSRLEPHPRRRAQRIVDLALDEPELSPRELAVRFTDTAALLRLGSLGLPPAQGPRPDHQPGLHRGQGGRRVPHQTTAPNQLWQTDFTYLKVIGWGWFYLSTMLDDFSRYIIAWKLCTSMPADDVTDTLELALTASGCAADVVHKPRLLSDNGPSYIAGELAKWLADTAIDHVRGAPCHPQTQGKIERWHQTLKNRILLENYYLPGDLEAQIEAFVAHYNHHRYHESLRNLTPADVYFGRGQTILLDRERIKRQTIQQRRLIHQSKAA